MSREPTVPQILQSVGLPGDFLEHLLRESDWSLVIKLHAVFESVLASLIVQRLATPQTAEVVSHLEFNNAKSGKVAFARALGLLESRDVAFLRGLSELRNQLVHRIENISFTFSRCVAGHSAAERKKFKKEFGFAILQVEGGTREYEQLLKNRPRTIVHLAAYECLLNIQFRVSAQRRNALVEALLQRSKK
ncbi:MAG: hypothetical protein AB7G48_18390 [Nitrospiraceae bacterium]